MNTESELKAIRSFVFPRTVPLVIEDSGRRGVQGTGALVHLAGKAYFVTARHVVDNLDLNRVGIPVAPTRLVARYKTKTEESPLLLQHAHMFNFRRSTTFTSSTSHHDVAVVALEDPSFVAAVEQTWTFLTPANFLRRGERVASYLLCGFPVSLTQRVADGTLLRPLSIQTQRIPPPQGAIDGASPPDPATDVFFEYGKQVVESDRTVDSPKLSGMSGSLVWGLRQDEETGRLWTPEMQVGAAAVMFAFFHPRYIRAKNLSLLVALFSNIDPAAAEELRAATGGDA